MSLAASDHGHLVERVVRTVDAQTTDRQPDDVAEHRLLRLVSWRSRNGERGNFEWVITPDAVEAAIETAVDEGRIVATSDSAMPRYRLTED